MCNVDAIREAYSDLTAVQVDALNSNLHIAVYGDGTAQTMADALGTLDSTKPDSKS